MKNRIKSFMLIINRIIFLNITLLLLFLISCNNRNKNDLPKSEKPYISIEETTYDYGEIDHESDGRCYFTFENTSDKPLIINRVGTSCGCTRPEWPREPVEPGESGRIGVSYNTKLAGNFRKSITVYSNAENSPLKLFIKGTVKPPKAD